ncbi:hypothetical protein [Cerasicoccus fimbriatus]|uniref:hypothetical protein n=1 Tax=Cerasicoccus fimbriatus TaxID=3014554 RepID=UPI0022B43383|nr:hypothetical protein [Cerasicoccus sp. TK19100]
MKKRRNQKSRSWLKNFLDDYHYFRTHGLSNRRKKLRQWWKLRQSSFRKWKLSRPIEKKIREQERKKSAEKFNRSVAKAPKKAKEGIGDFRKWVFGLPGETIKSARSWIKKARKMTLRELAGELWQGYLGLIAYLIIIPRNYLKWAKRKSAWLRYSMHAGIVGFILVMITSPLIIRQAKHWRANTLHQEASSLLEREQVQLAYEKSRTASLLEPDQKESLEQTLDIADRLRHPHTIWWAERVAHSRNFDSESLANIVEHSIDYGQLGIGNKYLSIMRSRYPESQSSADMELELLLRQERREDAISKSMRMVLNQSNSPLAHRVFVEHGMFAGDSELHQTALNILSQQIERKDGVGLELAKLGLRLPPEFRKNIPFDTRALRDIVVNHPLATSEDRIEANGLASFLGEISQKEAYEAILAEYEDDEIADALESLSRFDVYYGRNQLIPEEKIFTDSNYALSYIEWLVLAEDGNIPEAEALLTGEAERALPINNSQKRFWQAMIANVRGDEKEFSVRLLQSLENSTTSDWNYMHYLLVKHTESRHQHAFYRELFGRPESPLLSAERYLILSYQLGYEEELQILLRQIQPERFASRPDILSFLMYLNAIHQRNLTYTRQRLEKLIGQYPKSVPLYRNLAFVYAMSGERMLARSINSELPPISDESSIRDQLMCAYIMDDPSLLPELEELPLKIEQEMWRKLASERPAL